MDLDDIRLFDPDTYVDSVPHEQFALLRREAPVFRHELEDGRYFWCLTRHADLVTANRDASAYSSWSHTALTMPQTLEDVEQQRMMMLNMDPPEHSKLRKIVNKGFTPRMIRQLMDHLAEEARVIVAEAVEEGDVEFVERVASELPLIAIAEFLGVPREDRKILFDLSNRLIGSEDPDYQVAENEAQLAAMDKGTRPRSTRLLRAGGSTMARNMAYSATPSALSARAGKISPHTAPSAVPSTHPGIAKVISPSAYFTSSFPSVTIAAPNTSSVTPQAMSSRAGSEVFSFSFWDSAQDMSR